MAVGENFTLVLFVDGKTWGFGGTLHKKSGKGTSPTPISVLDRLIVKKIDCGIYHSIALTD